MLTLRNNVLFVESVTNSSVHTDGDGDVNSASNSATASMTRDELIGVVARASTLLTLPGWQDPLAQQMAAFIDE